MKNEDRFYVFKSIVKDLTVNEIKVLFESGIPFTGFSYDIINEMWNITENIFEIYEQKEVILNILRNLRTFKSPYFSTEFKGAVNSIVNNLKKKFTNYEIYDLFVENNILYHSSNFSHMWYFLINHITEEQQNTILRQTS